jgi:hypothetical protein
VSAKPAIPEESASNEEQSERHEGNAPEKKEERCPRPDDAEPQEMANPPQSSENGMRKASERWRTSPWRGTPDQRSLSPCLRGNETIVTIRSPPARLSRHVRLPAATPRLAP